jgi:hypothetical protein
MGPENRFIDGIVDLLKTKEITLYDGTVEYISDVHIPRLPSTVGGNTHFVIVPLGPQYDITIMGRNANMSSRSKKVAIMLFILHDGIDETVTVRNLSELTFKVAEIIMDNIKLRPGGADYVHIIDTDYDWATVEDQDDNSLTVSSTSSMLIVAEYGRG